LVAVAGVDGDRVSIAGPHNWLEARYFLMRLPARFGRSRNFFAVAFAGIFILTLAYVSLPSFTTQTFGQAALAHSDRHWNTLLLLWLGALVLMRGKQNSRRDWFWALPVTFVFVRS